MRVWRGRAPLARADEFTEYQRQVGPPGYRVIQGNQGILMLGRELAGQYEIAMVTFWESWDSIRAFAGDPVDKAKYYDRDFEFLIDPPKTVDHFDVVAAEGCHGAASVARIWTGHVEVSRAEEALRDHARLWIPPYRRIAGNRGVYLLGRELDHQYEVTMLTLWNSMTAIREFAGDPPDQAQYDDYIRLGYDYLIELPDKVEHLEILKADNFPILTDGQGHVS